MVPQLDRWSESALAHAAGSKAWLTKSEWLGFIEEAVAAGEICPAGAANLRAQLEHPEHVLSNNTAGGDH